jgi:hypothetical protein
MTFTNDLVETHLKSLRAIESRLELTQRQLAKELDVTLGKAHYCMVLIDKGLVKIANFIHCQEKLDYASI